jgi:DEAD/DEAH box helicase domain-containing protein
LDVDAFLNDVRSSPEYAGQMVYVREVEARLARFAAEPLAMSEPVRRMLRSRDIDRLYAHQAEAIETAWAGENVLVATGTASGKSLCYIIPIVERLLADPDTTALLLFPTKALCQDQFKAFHEALNAAGLDDVTAGVYDGDTPSHTRRKLRQGASVVFSNPDMLHAALMPQHARWAEFLSRLALLVIDELHVYNGIFGSNAANLFRRFRRVCAHYGGRPQVIACSATIGNPRELGERLTGGPMTVVDEDGSPRGRRTYVFWNPPRVRGGAWRSRRSANVEAHELMAMLVRRSAPTITFSKAKMTAEMIYRYVSERLRETAPALAEKVTPYRGGYLPGERREIERRLFSGELLGVSTTRALELGIDVGGLDAAILVGYPGTLASFFQQSGRAGRQDRAALVVLVGLDTAVNQYVMTQPEYLFGRPVEQGVIDPDNPFVLTGHLRCAAHELPVEAEETERFGPHTERVLRLLEENRKLTRVGERWYHAASETPQHEFSLRDYSSGTVTIEDADTGAVLGRLDKFDAPPIVHPGAIYMHRGDTYRVLDLDLDDKHAARVRRVEVDYYTQPLGGQDVHHIDHRLREKSFGTGAAFWGEVTAYDHTWGYEKVHFYSLDAISRHGVDLPRLVLETMAVWLVPPEDLMETVRKAGLDAHAGCRGIGYATRMLLPLYITCDTLDFSHSVGSVNSPWNAIFIYERYPHGLGFTERAYDRLHIILPAVLDTIRTCPCEDGCPCCVGKPLRPYATWNVERHEASIPSKAAARMILEGMLGDGANLENPDTVTLTDSDAGDAARLDRALRRRLERGREPQVFHPIEPRVETAYPEPAGEGGLGEADVASRAGARRGFHKELRRRLAKKIDDGKVSAFAGKPGPPPGTHRPGAVRKPTDFRGLPARGREEAQDGAPPQPKNIIALGDSVAARARKRKKDAR